MDNNERKFDLINAVNAGFVDGSVVAKEEYLPRLVVNNYSLNSKVLTSLLHELETCDEFYFSVAFVTNSGVAAIINALLDLQEKGVKGKIIASQYQNFTEPKALRRLISFNNLDVRIQTENNFHAKGYIFKHGDQYTSLIGSSNLTQNALSSNTEWNIKICSLDEGFITNNLFFEFNRLFEQSTPVTEEWISQYEKIYDDTDHYRIEAEELKSNVYHINRIQPNKMQTEALNALDNLRNEGKDKALLISATGTGKTYLSAFDVKIVKPKKFLFVVHRENIAKAAKRTFENVFEGSVAMGMYTGNKREENADYLFSTIQTISKDNHLTQFKPDEFDYIVIDEVHRSGADSYQKIFNYFKPKFLLGMSATPERTDGYDIFKQFDYNIAYEIRLNDALGQNMLSPFHYYGVTDITVNGEVIDDDSDFSMLTCDERVKHIVNYIDFYGCDRGRIKGLIFCSRVEEAYELSDRLNEFGFKTIALSGNDSETDRETAIRLLESDDKENYLDYIITVDIFNEGIDIPGINQIVMLRPTQSAIIFVQQLGRGLRKILNKDYLTVIDFIGNYSNNYLVPIALYGDRSFNKDTLRKLISCGSAFIPGSSTINFDQISKERIYKAINEAKTDEMRMLKHDFKLLEYELGRVPSRMDFVEHGSRDPYSFVLKKKSYFSFLCYCKPEQFQPLSDKIMGQLAFFDTEICNGKRLEEVVILENLLDNKSVSINELRQQFESLGIPFNNESVFASVNVLNSSFWPEQSINSYFLQDCFGIEGERIIRTNEFDDVINNTVVVNQIRDAIKYSYYSFLAKYDKSKYRNGFILYEKYSRRDVCRILNWNKNIESTLYGYRIRQNACPIFVTYKKKDDISASTMYDDYFINQRQFHWMTRNRVELDSTEPREIFNYKKTGLRICLFVKQSDSEGSDFYYIGDVEPYDCQQLTIKDDNDRELPIVNINFNIIDQVADNIYYYFKPYE